MKSYNFPAVILVAASALILAGVGASMKHAKAAALQLESDRASLDQARLELAAIDRAATVAAAKSVPANRFLEAWTPRLTASASIDEILGRLDTIAVDNVLSPSGKTYSNSSKYFFNGRQLSVQSINITVAGDFARTLTWLGAVESAFPLARVQQISYTSTSNSLALAAEIVFPKSFDLQ